MTNTQEVRMEPCQKEDGTFAAQMVFGIPSLEVDEGVSTFTEAASREAGEPISVTVVDWQRGFPVLEVSSASREGLDKAFALWQGDASAQA